MLDKPTRKTCSIEDCERPLSARQMCTMHYGRWQKANRPPVNRTLKPCTEPGCEKVARLTRGLCNTHYMRWLRHGSTGERPRAGVPYKTIEERFWYRVQKTDTCWLWTGGTHRLGYGVFGKGAQKYAHRVAYVLLVGPIPNGLELDHLCRNRICVNPDHLEPVTHAENVRRSSSPIATAGSASHCKWGHPLSGENLAASVTQRRCRTCVRESSARRRASEQSV